MSPLSRKEGLEAETTDLPLLSDDEGRKETALRKKEVEVLPVSVAWILFCFAFYCTAGPFTIFLNQYLLTRVHFPYPAALSMMGVTMSALISLMLIALGVVSSERVRDVTPSFYLRRVAPIGFGLAGTLATGNGAYLHLSISFIQILKALSPVILLSLLWISRIEKPRTILALSIFVISIGMISAIHGEMRATWIGLGLMFASELFDSVKAINMQILLSDKKFDSFQGLAVFGPSAAFGLALVSYFTEDYEDAMNVIASNRILFLVASLSGLAVNLATNMYIKATSALTLRITSLARNVVIVLLAAAFKPGNSISVSEFAGYLVSLCGVGLYNFARINPDATVSTLLATLRSVLASRNRLAASVKNSSLSEDGDARTRTQPHSQR